MWERAVEQLNDEDRLQIDFSQEDKRTALNDLLLAVEDKKREQKHLRFKNKNGETVAVRDLFTRITDWVDKFKEVGDVLSQYDPQHAAVPWAAVRFVLQSMINDSKTYDAMASGLEHVSSLIARYSTVEGLYLQSSLLKEQLAEALLNLYSAMLVFLAKARRYYTQCRASKLPSSERRLSQILTQSLQGRAWRSVVQTNELAVGKHLNRIAECENRVNEIARVINVECKLVCSYIHPRLILIRRKACVK